MRINSLLSLRTRRGFTLIEMIAVLGAIGVVASMAALRVRDVREDAYVVTMKHDLHTYAVKQENRRVLELPYVADPAEMSEFRFSPDVSSALSAAAEDRWVQVVRHAGTDIVCMIRSGPAESMENRIACFRGEVLPPQPLPHIAVNSIETGVVVSSFPTHFDARESIDQDGGEIVHYTWEVDGQVFSGPELDFTFPTPGFHTVRLTVTDDEGWTSVVEQTVEVRKQWLDSPDDLAGAQWLKIRGVAVNGSTLTFAASNSFVCQEVEGFSDPGDNGDSWEFFTLTSEWRNYHVQKVFGDQILRFTVRARGADGQGMRLRLDWNKDCNNCALNELVTWIGPHNSGGAASFDVDWAVAYFAED